MQANRKSEGPTCSPRGKFPIYSSSLPNTWEPIKRMNGIVAVAAMLRAALGVHEIRACRPVFLSLSLSLLIFHFLSLSVFFLLSSSFTFSLSLGPLPCSFLPFYSRCRTRLPLFACPPLRSLPPPVSSRIETPLCRVASGITMNLHSFASNSEHIASL